MSYTRVKTFNAGSSRTGLATVAWSLDGGGTWSTTGVSEAPAGSGIYKASITFADDFDGVLSWTTGDASPRYASEDIAPAQIDHAQPVPTSNTAQTVGDALNAARAQGFGKWVISGTSLTLYAADGTTAVRTLILDSATNPTSRS